MFLKRIEMQGFKSFADNIKITFDDPVTGIVGPNGCGKSNISDAIRWVLGEQSVKSLRGEKMTDIPVSPEHGKIFSGWYDASTGVKNFFSCANDVTTNIIAMIVITDFFIFLKF